MFGVIKEVSELQKEYRNLIYKGTLTKKNICNLVIPFRNKYKLKDSEALQIARDEISLPKIITLLEKSLNVKCDMKRWYVERPNGNCIVSIMRNKSDDTYSFINITDGHICTCKFNSIEDALKDMENKKQTGEVIDWHEL